MPNGNRRDMERCGACLSNPTYMVVVVKPYSGTRAAIWTYCKVCWLINKAGFFGMNRDEIIKHYPKAS